MKKALILAGGTGSRLDKKQPKQFHEVNGKMLIEYTIEACKKTIQEESIFIVCHKSWIPYLKKKIRGKYNIIPGGKTRIESTMIGLTALQVKKADCVFILESNRPLIKSSWLTNIYKNLTANSNSYAGMYTQPISESIFKLHAETFLSVSKKDFFIAQTPYIFTSEAVAEILSKAKHITDDQLDLLSLLDSTRITRLPANFENIKVTTRKDLETIKMILW